MAKNRKFYENRAQNPKNRPKNAKNGLKTGKMAKIWLEPRARGNRGVVRDGNEGERLMEWRQIYGARRTPVLYQAWRGGEGRFVKVIFVPCPGWSEHSPRLVQEVPQLVVI